MIRDANSEVSGMLREMARKARRVLWLVQLPDGVDLGLDDGDAALVSVFLAKAADDLSRAAGVIDLPGYVEFSDVGGDDAVYDDHALLEFACASEGVDPEALTVFRYRDPGDAFAIVASGTVASCRVCEDGASPSGRALDLECWNVSGPKPMEMDGGRYWGYPTARTCISDVLGGPVKWISEDAFDLAMGMEW